MKVKSSSSKFFLFLAAAVLALTTGIFAFGSAKTPSGHTGQALSLQALLHPGLAQSHLAQVFRQDKGRWTRSSNGRFVYSRNAPQYRSKSHASTNGGPVIIDEPVQTFDVFLPPPAFTPSDGVLTPTNSKPVWSADGSYFVFSSNRAGKTSSDPLGHFHLWAVSSAGDPANPSSSNPQTLTQITSGPGNELDPALNSANNALTFTSDAQSPNVQNLYAISFPTQNGSVDVSTLTSLTINSNSPTGFSGVSHPTWSPDSTRIAFAARSTTGATAGFTHIYFLYTATGGYLSSGGNNNPPAKLSDGMTNDADPSWSADGSYIFFDSTATSINPTGQPIAPNPANPGAETSPSMTSGGDGVTRKIFAIFPNGTNGGSVTDTTQTANDDSSPALRTEADGVTVDLTFARRISGGHSKIVFEPSTYTFDPNTGAPTTAPNGTNTQTLDSSDADNAFDDTQPVWSPVTNITGGVSTSTVNSIAYVSNRTITYNDPTTSAPLELPVSIAQGKFNVGAAYSGILQSQIDQINPPTLLPYSGDEVIHVTDTNSDTPRRNGDIQPGQKVRFTVRLSSREAGVDSGNVYIQIKDPDSKYQDADRLEHKVFTTDTIGADSGSSTRFLFNASAFSLNPTGTELGQGGSTKIGNVFYGPFYLFGVPAGFDGGNSSVGFYDNVSGSPITVGRIPNNDGTTNPIMYSDPNSTANPKPLIPLPGVDPLDFTAPLGQEYEAQYLDAQFGINGNTSAQPGDYGTPFYLAGVDDQGAHSGTFMMPRPEWLKLTPVVAPDANGNDVPDAAGGILYTATWATPTSPSDFFLDVIAYDKAVDPATGQSGPNFRIYDNVWGFSTQPFSGTNNILVVSDNALGQKFAATTFSGKGLSGLRPLFYGAESYMTDIDVNLLPNAVFQYMLPTGTMNQYTRSNGLQFGFYPNSYPTGPNDPKQDQFPSPIVIPLYPGDPSIGSPPIPVLNGLGVGSYNEDSLNQNRNPGPVSQDEVTIDGRSTPKSQQYSVWRILARGSVPQNVLNSYAPTFVSQPAVNDTAKPGINGNPSPFTAPAATIPNALRCVVWVSPFTGDLPLNQGGSLADPATQQTVENFLKVGGRLFVTGQDVGSAITVDGSVNNTPAAQGSPGNFLPDFLNATLASSNRGTQTLTGDTGQGKRISSDAFVNVFPKTFGKTFILNSVNMFFPELQADGFDNYVPPGTSALYLGNNYRTFIGNETKWRTDGSLDQLGPIVQSFGGNNQVLAAIDTLTPVPGAHTDITSNGAASLIYNENTATGARVVYAGFGLEGIGTEYYKVNLTGPPTSVAYVPRNLRQNILHNIVCYLRTGTFTGQVVNGGGGGGGVSGGGVAGATVYLVPDRGVTLPTSRQTFSATTDGRGNYTISGVEPGSYTVVAYKQGFTRSVVGVGSGGTYNNALPFAVEGDTTTRVDLNLTPAPKGSITGKVTDSSNAPINGATITFVSTDGQFTVTGTSGTDGTYTINAVTPSDYTGTASDNPKFGISASQAVTVAASQAVSGINFVLPPGPGTLYGLVTDVNGNAVLGATITITDTNGNAVKDAAGNPVGPFTTTTPTPGPSGGSQNYTDSIPPGAYLVTASGTGFTTTRAVTVTINTAASTRQDFTLSPGPGVVGGLVTDKANGQPVSGATVTVTNTDGSPVKDSNGNAVGPFTTTASPSSPNAPGGDSQPLNFNGSVPPGTYVLTVSAFGFATSQPVTFTITQGNFTRVPTPAMALVSTIGTVGGLVTDKATGNALTGATITVLDSAGNTAATAQTANTPSSPTSPDGDGNPLNYAVRLPSGRYSLTVSAGGHAQAGPINFTIRANAFVRKDAPLSASPGTLGGLVTAKGTNQPVSGATVTITDTDGNPVKDSNGNAVGPFITGVSSSPAAGPAGDGSPLNYSGLVPPGTYLVKVTSPNTTSPAAAAVTVVTNAFVRADVVLTPAAGTLGGTVKDGSGNLIGGATINIIDGNGNVLTTFTSSSTATATKAGSTDGDGNPINFRGPLLPGTYAVTATAPGFGTSPRPSITITSNNFTRQDFVLTSSLGTLGGLVTDPVSGNALNGALVSVTDSSGKVIATATTTDTTTSPSSSQGDGQPLNYSISLSQGTYNVTVTARGYNSPAAKPVIVTVGGFTRADFTGTSGLGTIHLFGAGLNFFSVPYNYGASGGSFDALLGTLNTNKTFSPASDGSNRSHIYVYDPSQLQYVLDPTPPADSLHLGQGYWVYLLKPHAVTTAAPVASSSTIAVGLKAGWNMIGVPSLQAISVSGLHFANAAGGGTLDFATATGNAYRLVSGTLYGYNGSSYVPVTAGGTMQPWQAYWIYVYANTTVLIPTGS